MNFKAETKVGIGVIGAGLIGAFHCSCLLTIIERTGLPVWLCHIADTDEDKAYRLKREFGFKKAGADPMAVIHDPEVSAVYICTWTSEHLALVREVAREGKHVFCEKPLAFTEAEARQMEHAVSEAGVINQVGLVLRQGPVWNVLRDEIKTRRTGKPQALIFRDDQCFPIKGAHPSTWRKDRDKAGHGTLIEHSIHDLDLVEWMFGPLESVRAETRNTFGYEDIEDLARVDIEFCSGMTGVLVSVWHDVLQRHSNRRLDVFFEQEFMAVESEYTGPLTIMEGEGDLTTWEEEEVNKKYWDLQSIQEPVERELSVMYGVYPAYLFCQSLLSGKPAGPGFAAAVRAHKLVDACYLSARSGERVKIDADHEIKSKEKENVS
ncbi:MAG: Gfo/Idh/MocA family oxidoreductase [bacterium]